MDWAEDKFPTELEQFDFVFLVALKNVSKNIPLEELILQQHEKDAVNGCVQGTDQEIHSREKGSHPV